MILIKFFTFNLICILRVFNKLLEPNIKENLNTFNSSKQYKQLTIFITNNIIPDITTCAEFIKLQLQILTQLGEKLKKNVHDM